MVNTLVSIHTAVLAIKVHPIVNSSIDGEIAEVQRIVDLLKTKL